MAQENLISIIVPVYNAQDYLERCITSLINQSYKNIEVLLINDSSSDNSKQICEKYAQLDSRVLLYNKENEGAGLARNYGISKAKGNLVAFCDADDYFISDMCYIMEHELSLNNRDLVYCLHTNERRTPNITGAVDEFKGKDAMWHLMLGEVGTEPSNSKEVLYGSAVWRGLYKMNIIKENNISFLSERVVGSEDLIFNLEYLTKCNSVGYVMDELYCHCDNEASMTHSKFHFLIEHELELYKRVGDILEKSALGSYDLELKRMFIKRVRNAVICMGRAFSMRSMLSDTMEIRKVLKNDLVEDIFKNYPGNKLPIKQAIMFYCMKYKLVISCVMLSRMS